VRYLGLDVGDRFIGVALSDETATLATGLPTLRRVGPRKDVRAIVDLVRRNDAVEIVVGLPRRLDGGLGPQAQKVLAFMEDLRPAAKVPLVPWDERFTSVVAEQALIEGDVSRRDRKSLVDKVAAILILQNYLDYRKLAEAGRAAPGLSRGFVRKILLLLLLVAGVVCFAWFHETQWPVRSAADPPQSLFRRARMDIADIGRQLTAWASSGIERVPGPRRVEGDAGRLRAGSTRSGEMSLDEIVDKMARGDVVHHMVTFPEGTAREEMARIVAGQGIPPAAFLEAARDVSLVKDLDPAATDLEGYLFPDTYEVEPRRADAAAALVKRMVHRFREVVAPSLERLKASGHSLREVVTLASLVELETARKEERPHIAAVFLNRLQRRMPLQTDPTVIYALRLAGTWDGNIRKDDLGVDSPYNTYRYPGLPPGPIASPGREAIRAVLEPLASEDLYFVSRNDGSHQFSRTLAEHERAVTLYQRHRRSQVVAAPRG
jgi:UPF0755 protein